MDWGRILKLAKPGIHSALLTAVAAIFANSFAFASGYEPPSRKSKISTPHVAESTRGISGEVYLLPDSTSGVRALLEAGNLQGAVTTYFGTAFDDSIVRWVVYIDKAGKAHQAFVGTFEKGAKGITHLYGEREVWVFVFAATTTATIEVGSSELKHHFSPGEYLLAGVVKGYNAIFNTAAVATDENRSKESPNNFPIKFTSSTIKMEEVETKGDGLHLGKVSIPLLDNTRNRLSLRPITERSITAGGLTRVYHSFINGESSKIGAGLVFGADFDHVNETKGDREDAHADLYLAAHWASFTGVRGPWPGELRFGQRFGGFAGVSVRDTSFTSFVAGFSLQLAGQVSFATGITANRVKYTRSYGTRAAWEPRPFAGILYGL